MPLLCIIIPVYNPDTKHLELALESAVTTLPVDASIYIGLDGDCSPKCWNVIDQIKSRYRSIHIKEILFPKRGIAETLNSLIDYSDCKFIARHDSDDICLPGRFSSQLSALESEKDLSFCGTQIIRCNSTLKPHIYQRKYPRSFTGQLIYSSILNNPIAHPTLMMKRNILPSTVYRDLAGAEDWDLYIRLWTEGHKSINLKSYGLAYRIHENQVTQKPRDWQMHEDLKHRSLIAAEKHNILFHSLKPVQDINRSLKLSSKVIKIRRLLEMH